MADPTRLTRLPSGSGVDVQHSVRYLLAILCKFPWISVAPNTYAAYIMENVAIFWDYENCPVPSNASGYAIVDHLRTLAEPYGSVRSLKAYIEVTEQTPTKNLTIRSELQSSGVSLVDCPHNGRKDVADKMIIVDMLAYALDNPAPSTIVLITGDRDFAYAMSILRLRRYRIVLVTLPNAHLSLTAQATVCLNWNDMTMSVPNDTASNAFGYFKSSPSQDIYSVETATSSPRAMYSRLRPETADHCKPVDTVQTPRSEILKTLPANPYTPEPNKSPELVRPTLRDNFGKPALHPFKTTSPLSQSNNASTSYVCQSNPVIPTADSSCSQPSDKPFVVPTEINDSLPSPGPPRSLNASDPGGRDTLTTTREPLKLPSTEPTLSSGPPLPTFQPSTQTNIEPPVVPVNFKVLVQCLQRYRLQGNFRPLRSVIGLEVAKSDVFKKVGVDRFKQYALMAVKMGIVELGGTDGGAWIFLRPQWVNAK